MWPFILASLQLANSTYQAQNENQALKDQNELNFLNTQQKIQNRQENLTQNLNQDQLKASRFQTDAYSGSTQDVQQEKTQQKNLADSADYLNLNQQADALKKRADNQLRNLAFQSLITLGALSSKETQPAQKQNFTPTSTQANPYQYA